MKKNCNRHIHEKIDKEFQLYNDIKTDNKLRYNRHTHDITDDKVRYDRTTHDIGCQYDSKCGDVICKCKNSSKRSYEVKHFGTSKQVYAYHKTNFTDIGVSSVKTVQRKKVKRIYLPETENRGVGSSDLSPFISRNHRRTRGSYYDHKTTSSKCVGGVRKSTVECVIDAKLSPLMRMNSASTNPKTKEEATTTQLDNVYIGLKTIKPTVSTQESPTQTAREVSNSKLRGKRSRKSRPPMNKKVTDSTEKVFSTESLVQHVHNLENQSNDEQSFTSFDPMENKLEREYRKMFSTKSKDPKLICEQPLCDLRSASLLRRRFEALRRSLAQKENSKKNAVMMSGELSPTTIPSKNDVSIASDPPSLEARSYSFTKAYSPDDSVYDQDETGRNPKAIYKKAVVNKIERGKSQTGEEVDEEGVKGMFKLWGEKFNFEEKNYKNMSKLSLTKAPHKAQKESKTSVTNVTIKPESEYKKVKKFFFFGRKNKDKTKPHKTKKGVTAGRCEVKDGLIFKIGKVNSVHDTATKKEPEKPNCDNVLNEYESILGKAWLKNFLEQTIESKNSAQIRWNNKMYATSSSTVFELMDNVYNQTELDLKSNSEMSIVDSLFCRSFKKQQVNFLQDVEAWMIPKLITERPKQQPVKVIHNNVDETNNIKIKNMDRKCFIDKSKAFARKIEVVLHSKNFINRRKKPSSEYLKIDIPKDFFSESVSICDERGETSNSEEVYNIVEYITPESNIRFRINKGLDMGPLLINNINATVSVKDKKMESKIHETDIKESAERRDVDIQGSNVCVPRLCDVIGVGIITQRDLKEIRKPILKIQYDYTDDESDCEHVLRSNQKTCEFAESYLQDFYRHWIPLGMDVYSWCVGDLHPQCSDTSQIGANNQDGTKSCPNIYDDYQGSTIISSCTTSSCSRCNACDDNQLQCQSLKFFRKFKRKNPSESNEKAFFKVLPKDSCEVFKRRKLYACSNKSKWFCADDKPYSTPSKEDKCEDTLSKSKTICYEPKKKPCKKHVSLPGCADINDLLTKQLPEQVSGILVFKGAAGCDACKNKDYCAKHSQITESPPCEIPQPPCKQSCEENKKPECSKPNQSSCNINQSLSPKSSSPISPKSTICSPPFGTHSPPCPPLPNYPKPLSPPIHLKSPSPVFPKCSPTPTCFKTPPISSHTPPCQPPSCPQSTPCLPQPSPCRRPPPRPQTKTCTRSPPCSCSAHPKPVCPHPPKKKPQSSKYTPPPGSPSTPCSLKSLLPVMKSSCDCCTKKQFQCPMNNRVSNQFSSALCNKNPQEKSQQVTPSHSQMDCQTQKSQILAKPCTKPKSGLYLKKEPNCPPPKKKRSHPPSNNICTTPSLSSLISNENLRIRVNKTTPSTEEIREGVNIKVQDADGQTLYERRDYTTHRSSIIGEIYNVHQVSTPRVQSVQLDKINNVEQVKAKSEASIANQIEIHFKLKLTPGNKTTEMKIDNEGETETEISKKNDIRQTSQDVFVVKEADESTAENFDDKNDININIVIKNYNTKSKKEHIMKDYSNKISDKFHSASTGYSVVDDQIFSLHETKIEVKSSEEIMVQEFADNATTSTIHDTTINKEPAVEDASIRTNLMNERESQILNAKSITKSNSQIQSKFEEIQEQKSETPVYATNENEQESILEITSDEPSDFNNAFNIPKPRTTQEKTMLKMVFEKADDLKKKKRKNRMNILKQMLKTILSSDSSDQEEITATSSGLKKKIDKTNASLTPSCNRDTDSMNNYYCNDSIVENSDDKCNATYPTEVHSAESIKSGLSEPHQSQKNCVCSSFAARLNLKTIGGGCCCRRVPLLKVNEETHCDLNNEIDLLWQKCKVSEYCNVQIQSSIKSNEIINRESIAEVKSRKMIKVIDDMSKESDLKSNDDKNEVKSKMLKRTFSPHVGYVKDCTSRKLNKNTILGFSGDDNIRVIKDSDNKNKENRVRRKETVYYTKNADILQSYDTKKAVLEIYAEKTISRDGEYIVAKLPKFVYNKESEIVRNYREIMAKCNSGSDMNIVL